MAEGSEEVQAPEDCNCPPKGAPAWVVTFGDMMSLLLCFFVLLLSFSTTDISKYKEMIGSLKDAFGLAQTEASFQMPTGKMTIMPNIEIPRVMAALVSVRAKAAQLAKSSSELEMESGADWVRLKVNGDALFESGAFTIRPEAESLLNGIGETINKFDGTVMIEGHTDGDPPTDTRFTPGSYLGNYELGSMRSISVLGYLVGRMSVDKEKLIPTTMGEVKPRETNEFAEGKARNRRVEFEFRSNAKADISNVQGEPIKN